MPNSDYATLPVLGAGIGLRKQHFCELRKTQAGVGWLEIVPENFMNFGGYPKVVLSTTVSEKAAVINDIYRRKILQTLVIFV